MKKILYAVLALMIATSLMAAKRPQWNKTSANKTYQVYAGTVAIVASDGLNVFASSATFTPTIKLYGDTGEVEATTVDAGTLAATTASVGTLAITGGNFNAQGKTWQLIYSTSNVLTSSFTVAGLNGNVDKEYYIVMIGSSTGQDIARTINGDTTNANYRVGLSYNVSDYMRYLTADERTFGAAQGAGTGFAIQYWQGALAASGMTYRYGNSTCMFVDGSIVSLRNYSTCWENSSDNITSMSFHAADKFYLFDFAIYARR